MKTDESSSRPPPYFSDRWMAPFRGPPPYSDCQTAPLAAEGSSVYTCVQGILRKRTHVYRESSESVYMCTGVLRKRTHVYRGSSESVYMCTGGPPNDSSQTAPPSDHKILTHMCTAHMTHPKQCP